MLAQRQILWQKTCLKYGPAVANELKMPLAFLADAPEAAADVEEALKAAQKTAKRKEITTKPKPAPAKPAEKLPLRPRAEGGRKRRK